MLPIVGSTRNLANAADTMLGASSAGHHGLRLYRSVSMTQRGFG